VHLWTGVWATIIAVMAFRVRRSHRAAGRALGPLLTAATVFATTAAVANLLEMVGAHPPLRAFHDTVNRICAPWDGSCWPAWS
jgi:hypothetical protein